MFLDLHISTIKFNMSDLDENFLTRIQYRHDITALGLKVNQRQCEILWHKHKR